MARPALRGTVGFAGGAATSVVVLVDRSGSMGANASGGARGATLLDEARRVVEDLLGSLGPQDEILLVPYDRTPQPVTPRPSSDLGRVRAAIQGIAGSAATTDHEAALALAARSLGESRALNRELFWISDFQRTGLGGAARTEGGGAPPDRLTAPDGPWRESRVFVIPINTVNRANAMVSDALLAPGDVETSGSSAAAALSVSIASFDAPAGDLAVEVTEVGTSEALGRGFASIPARGEGSTLLPLGRLPDQGGIARIPDDALLGDNARVFASGRSGTLRIVLREDGAPSALRLALEAGSPASGLAVEVGSGTALAAQLADADALVIHDVERLGPVELQAVLDYYRSGGALVLAIGRQADPAFWNSTVLRETGAGTVGAIEPATAGAVWRLMRAVAGHPALVGFPSRAGEAFSSARFQSVRAFTPGAEGRVLLEFDRTHAALVEAPRALVLNVLLDPGQSDFAVSGAFLPLVHQAVKVLGRGTAAASLAPGDRYVAPGGTGVWRIERQDGREVAVELVSERGALRLRSESLEQPGLYRVLRDGRLRGTFAVNPEPRESDLSALAPEAIVAGFPRGRAQVLRPGSDLAQRVREARFGRELWGLFIIAALILLAAETTIARWGMTSRRVPAPA